MEDQVSSQLVLLFTLAVGLPLMCLGLLSALRPELAADLNRRVTEKLVGTPSAWPNWFYRPWGIGVLVLCLLGIAPFVLAELGIVKLK